MLILIDDWDLGIVVLDSAVDVYGEEISLWVLEKGLDQSFLDFCLSMKDDMVLLLCMVGQVFVGRSESSWFGCFKAGGGQSYIFRVICLYDLIVEKMEALSMETSV